jgi:hypothetical protein
MTNLTEQWKKGELPSGWYYTKLWKGCNVIDYFIGNHFLRYDDSDIVEVIVPVPTFDELQNMNEAVNQAMSANIKLVEQNKQLKELLKECQNMIAFKHEVYEEDALIKEIDEVLNA